MSDYKILSRDEYEFIKKSIENEFYKYDEEMRLLPATQYQHWRNNVERRFRELIQKLQLFTHKKTIDNDAILWILNQIKYKQDLNAKYRSLDSAGKPLYAGRILWGSGYIEALTDVLKHLEKDIHDNSTPD